MTKRRFDSVHLDDTQVQICRVDHFSHQGHLKVHVMSSLCRSFFTVDADYQCWILQLGQSIVVQKPCYQCKFIQCGNGLNSLFPGPAQISVAISSLVPRLSRNANMYHVPAQLQCSRSRAWEPGNEAMLAVMI